MDASSSTPDVQGIDTCGVLCWMEPAWQALQVALVVLVYDSRCAVGISELANWLQHIPRAPVTSVYDRENPLTSRAAAAAMAEDAAFLQSLHEQLGQTLREFSAVKAALTTPRAEVRLQAQQLLHDRHQRRVPEQQCVAGSQA